MNKQKIILISIITLCLLFAFYFLFGSKPKVLGSFDSFEPDSHKNKELVVKYVKAQGVDRTTVPGKVVFYAEDKNGKVVPIVAPQDVSKELENADEITITGHMHADSFEASKVEVE